MPMANDVSAMRKSAERLEEHARTYLATNQKPSFVSRLSDTRVTLPVFTLAVIGAVVSLGFIAAALWPIGLASAKWWFPS